MFLLLKCEINKSDMSILEELIDAAPRKLLLDFVKLAIEKQQILVGDDYAV